MTVLTNLLHRFSPHQASAKNIQAWEQPFPSAEEDEEASQRLEITALIGPPPNIEYVTI